MTYDLPIKLAHSDHILCGRYRNETTCFRSADVYCQILNNLNFRNIVIFILEQKEGEKGRYPERQRESVCERQSVAENGVGVRSKNSRWRKD